MEKARSCYRFVLKLYNLLFFINTRCKRDRNSGVGREGRNDDLGRCKNIQIKQFLPRTSLGKLAIGFPSFIEYLMATIKELKLQQRPVKSEAMS